MDRDPADTPEPFEELPDEVDVSPSPRILQVLGDIEFEQWQCIAELADNSFDELLDVRRAGIEWDQFAVTVILPSRDSPDQIEVRDTGRGMTIYALRDAVRAGWTGNDQFDKLGLFGMGFNIATARLGSKATVLTKRTGDARWVGVELDLRGIAQRGEFRAPVVTRPADDYAEHGTRVIVSDLKPEYSDWFLRNAGRLRTKLGDVYSYLLETENIRLYVGGQAVQSRRACLWASSRAVSRRRYGQREEIPAVIEIDKDLPDLEACGECRHWQEPLLGRCEVCGSTDIRMISRRIHGWIGIQRYLSSSDFGLDFLRNGRKILMRDRRLFEWEDTEGESGSEKEYPVEVPANEGRIVGEIHIDHVPVNYQKNAFEYDGREWRTVVRAIRGDGPLRDKLRREHGFTTANNSPLARLFDGYRRNDPGLNYLTPGNGTSAINEKAREWAKQFRGGDPEYQTDEKWYEAAERHDEIIERRNLAAVGGEQSNWDDGADILDVLGITDDARTAPQIEAVPLAPESEQDRQERFKSAAREIPHLSAEYSLPSVGAVKITAYLVAGARLTDQDGQHTPVYLSPRPRSQGFFAFVDEQHPVFSTYGSDYADFLLFEVANLLKTRASSPVPLGELVAQLKERHLQDLKLDTQVLSGRARELLEDIGDSMASVVGDGAGLVWEALSETERNDIETRFISGHSMLSAREFRQSGEYLRHLPPLVVPRVVQGHPELWLDGSVFNVSYAELAPANQEARDIALTRLLAYLTDIALLAEGGRHPVEELLRARHTINLLTDSLARQASIS